MVTYGNINMQVKMLNVVVAQQKLCLLTGLLKYLQRNSALLVQKWGGGNNCQNTFPAIKLEGEG